MEEFEQQQQQETNGDSGQQQPDKTFTQADVDRIVQERLAREKSKVADYDDLKELAQYVKEFGYKGATPAEIKAEVKAHLDAHRKKQELAELQEEAKTSGTSPELLAEIKALKKELEDIKQEKTERNKEVEARQKADQQWNDWVGELSTKHPEVDLEKLEKNEKFLSYLKRSNPSLSLLERYETFLELVGTTEKEAMAKVAANLERSTASGRSKGNADGGTYGLSDHQQMLAKQNGMSNKEYSELLSHVKRG